MCPPELLDEQLLATDKALEESLELRRQQLRRLNQQLQEVNNKITSARLQFDNETKVKRADLEREHAAKMREVQQLMSAADDQRRKSEESYWRQTQMEKDAKQTFARVSQKEAALAELNAERMEIAKLRRQAEQELETANELKRRAQAEISSAQKKLDESNVKLAASQKLDEQYKADWNRLRSQKDEVERQLKQYQLLKTEIDGKLDEPKKDVINGGPDRSADQPGSDTEGKGQATADSGNTAGAVAKASK